MTILTSLFGLLLLLQEAAASPEAGASSANTFTLTEMVKNMGGVAIAVVIVLLIMSVYSIAIMVERYLTYSAAKKQSREFAPRVAQALKNDRIEEAMFEFALGAGFLTGSRKRSISATSTASLTWRWLSAAACRSFVHTKLRAISRVTRSMHRSAPFNEQSRLRQPNSSAGFRA